jgi:coiled-coil domain-containing protein 12
MKTPLEITDIEVSNLAPKKIDFDLKRAISKKLQKLEKRTQMAISELIRMRLKSQNDEDFVTNINVGASEAAHTVDSD